MRRLIRRISKILLCLLVVTLGSWAIINLVGQPNERDTNVGSTQNQKPTSTLTPIPTRTDSPDVNKQIADVSKQITDLISPESPIFINYDNNQDRQAQEIQVLKKNKNFQAARQRAKSSGDPNYCGDPEILIGKNNDEIKNKESYAIAVVLPLDSDYEKKEAAKEVMRGVAQAQNDYNEQIKNNTQKKPLKVFIVNEKENDSSTKSIARALAEKQEFLGVIGHYTSDATELAIPIYNNNKIVLISPTSTKTKIVNGNGNGYFFRTVPNNQAEAKALVNYLLKNKDIQPKKVATFYNNDSKFSQSLKADFISYLNKNNPNINSNKTYDLSLKSKITPDQLQKDSQINESDKKFSVLMLAGTINDFKQIYDNLLFDEARKFFYLGGDTMYVPEQLTQKNGDIAKKFRNIAIAVPWHHTQINTESQNFVRTASLLWCQEQGKEDYITWRRATAYDATKVLVEAINSNPNPNRETVRQALSNNFSTLGTTGKIRFDVNGNLDAPSKLVRLFESDNSGERNYKFKLVNETGNPQQ